MIPISLILITKNAEEHVARCIRSVPFASDVVVVDSGSTDRTVEVARECGARVFVEEWRGFGPQKRRATELAKHDWVLNLDADEGLSDAAIVEMQMRLVNEPTVDAFQFPRLSFHLGRWIRHGGWYPDWQTRLYDRRRANWSSDQLHEKVRPLNKEQLITERFRGPIRHWVFRDLADQVATNNRYSTLGSEELQRRGRKFVLFNLLVKPKVKFFETYILKRGFLDGMPGFIIAVGAAYSVFLKWAKLWETERLKTKR